MAQKTTLFDRVDRTPFYRLMRVAAFLMLAGCQAGHQDLSPWDEMDRIAKRIVAPTFPDRDFLVTNYGAVPDGRTDCSEAFRAAIEECHRAGGGRVIVPKGKFLTGAIHLKSNVNLHVVRDATVLFRTDTAAYMPFVQTRWEGTELMGYSPLVYAFEEENIAITGSGTLDGQGDNTHWWPWSGAARRGWQPGMPSGRDNQEALYRMADEGVPVAQRVFKQGLYLRPHFVQPYRCRNVLIDSVTIVNSPFWVIAPDLCENVTVSNVKVISHGPNNDGCDPESCRDVLISNCYFDTGDDCIAIKSGRNADGRRVAVPSENIIIRNCRMKDGHGGVVIGSEISGGIRNVFAEDCVMDSPDLLCALRIKTNSSRGGFAENIFFRNMKIGTVGDVVRVNYYYAEGDAGSFMPRVRNVRVENVTSEKSVHALNLRGYPGSPVSDIVLKNCTFSNVAKGNVLINVQRVTADDVTVNGEELADVEDDRVPPAVLATVEKHLNGGHVRQVNKQGENDSLRYEFELQNGQDRRTLLVAVNGEVLSKENSGN